MEVRWWHRKTWIILLIAGAGLARVGPAPADEEASNVAHVAAGPYGRCYAKSVPTHIYDPENGPRQAGRTVVYRVEPEQDVLLARFDWFSQKLFLTCGAGKEFSLTRLGPWKHAGRLVLVGRGEQDLITSHKTKPRRKAVAIAPILVPSGYVAVAIGLGAITAAAQPADPGAEPGFYERLAFDAADTDGDGFVSEAELARDAAAGFSGLDMDRSETLTPEELGPHDPAMFAPVDANGDGVLSFSEVMIHKTEAFADADKDQDGKLSFEEMVDGVKAELGAAR